LTLKRLLSGLPPSSSPHAATTSKTTIPAPATHLAIDDPLILGSPQSLVES
jgi:hypothetical protein